MKLPKIKINVDCGEADIVNWEEFDQMYSLWRYDVLADLKHIINFKYKIAKSDYLNDLKKMTKKIKKQKECQ